MDREIKFRAWDKRIKQIREIETLFFDGARKCYEVNFTYGTPEVANLEQVILIQYTGLKDKNGKEIYEGDIVKDYEWLKYGNREVCFGEEYIDASDYEEYTVGVVGFYLTNYLGKEDETEGLNSRKVKDLEVVGNIYENQELIKQ